MSDGIAFRWYDIENDPEGWDRHVASMGQNLFHRNAILEAHQHGKMFRRGVLVTRAQRTVALLGGLLWPGNGGGWFHTLSFPRYQRHLGPELPWEVGHWLLDQGVTRVELGCLDGGVEDYSSSYPGRIANRCEFIQDLTRGEDEWLRAMSGDHRRKLRISEQEPPRLRVIEAGQAWAMTRLHRCWARRHGESFGLRRLIASHRFYRRLTMRLAHDRSGNLYGLCSSRGQVLALAYMLERDGSSFYLFGAEADAGGHQGSAVRLLWELARRYPGHGVHSLNLGSVPAEASDVRHRDHAVYRFKLGFGVQPTLRQSLSIGA